MMQQFIVLLIFLSALSYLGYRSWKSLKRSETGGCAKGCGCEPSELKGNKQKMFS